MHPIKYKVILRENGDISRHPQFSHTVVFRIDHVHPEDSYNETLFVSSLGWTIDTCPEAILDSNRKVIGGTDVLQTSERDAHMWRTVIEVTMLEYHEYINTKRSRFEMLEII